MPDHDQRLGLRELVAMGVGGMVGGGIFSVLGLSVRSAGHSAPLAFLAGGVIAMITGFSYAHLGLAFRSDGGSFTYLEKAFRHENVAGAGGWLLLAGYVGTLSLYAFTFGAYGSAMITTPASPLLQRALESGVVVVFLAVNLRSVRAAGGTEDAIVAVKLLILGIFAVVGFFSLRSSNLVPVFDQGASGLLMGAALIFVAYEGFELLPNAVNETRDAEHVLKRAIFISIIITTAVYVLVAVVAVGNLTGAQIQQQGEYALAVAAKPFLGRAGFLLIGLGALLSTASAINATLFGTARLGRVMAQDRDLPAVFSHREHTRDIPWVSLAAISAITLVFVNLANLTVISSFASATFLMIFAAVNLSALRLRTKVGIGGTLPLAGFVASAAAWLVLMAYLWTHSARSLVVIGSSWVTIAVAELAFSQRRLLRRRRPGNRR
jgi:amino acid transporter